MKTISIKQLHARTGHWVRAAKTQTIVVTDRGEKVAALQSHDPGSQPKAVFTLKGRSPRPKSPIDSTLSISQDRNRW